MRKRGKIFLFTLIGICLTLVIITSVGFFCGNDFLGHYMTHAFAFSTVTIGCSVIILIFRR